MNEERAMILKMLREGKISVEEADALLDVLNDQEEEEPAGFSASRAGDSARSRDEKEQSDEHVKFDFGLDLSGLTEGLRSAMSSVKQSMAGVSDTLKETFSELGDLEIHTDEGFFGTFRTEMGKARAKADRPLAFAASGASELKMSNPWGDVRVVGTPNAEITGTAHVTCWAADEEHAQALLDQTSVAFESREGVIVLEIEGEAKRKLRVDIEIEVPEELAVTVALAAGDLWLEGVTGPVVANTISGDLHVANIGDGPDVAQLLTTTSGDISATSVSGALTLSSASGDIAIAGYRGALRVTSQSGDIEVEDGNGPVEAKSVSGDLQVAIESGATIDGAIKLTTVGGDVKANVPEHLGYDVSITTLSGDIENELELVDVERTGRSRKGRYGDGAIPLSITTVSGDVELSQA